MRARDIRTLARNALRGRWGIAVAVCLVAGFLLTGVPSFFMASNTGNLIRAIMTADENVILHAMNAYSSSSWIGSLIVFILGGVVNFGLCDFFTRMNKGEQVGFKQLFGQFGRIGAGICMNFMVGLFTYLWSLLFVIPGIIAAYRYAMVPYLMAEFPDLGTMDAIRESKRLMHGNKWRLFCLELSFFGWAILAALTLGIGQLWLNPYMHAARAAFYMEVTGRGPAEPEQPVRPDYLNSPEF